MSVPRQLTASIGLVDHVARAEKSGVGQLQHFDRQARVIPDQARNGRAGGCRCPPVLSAAIGGLGAGEGMERIDVTTACKP